MNAYPQRHASLQRRTHQTRETLFYLDCLLWQNKYGARQPRPRRWFKVRVSGSCPNWWKKSFCHFNFACLCTCVIHENIVCILVHTWTIFIDSREFSCSDQRLSVHVVLHPTFIYMEAVTSRINPLSLTTSVVFSPFPFCKLHNLFYVVLVTLPNQ